MFVRLILGMVLLLAGSVSAFAQDTSGDVPQLDGYVWALQSFVSAEGKTADVLPDAPITLTFQGARYGGSAGCNQYSGSYSSDGASLEFSEAAVTRKLCAPEVVMQQEAAYLTALPTAASYQIVNGTLQIADVGGDWMMTFTRVEPLPLVGTTWTMAWYQNGTGGLVSALMGADVTAWFDASGQLSGSGGCNSYSATYEHDGSSLTIGQAVSTLMACPQPDGVMEQEQGYLTALGRSVSYTIRGDVLELKDGDGRVTVRYQAKVDLTGVEWQWQSAQLLDGDTVTVPNPENYTLQFDADGTFNIRADCNLGSGTYQLNGNQVRLEVGALTKVMCPPESLSDQYLLHLGSVEFLARVADDLRLSPGAAGEVLIFAAG